VRSPWCLLFFRLNKPRSLRLSSQEKWSTCLFRMCPSRTMSSLCWGLQTWAHYSKWDLMGAKSRGNISSVTLSGHLFFNAGQDIIHFLCCKCTLLALVEFFIHHNLPELLSIHSLPILYVCLGVPGPRWHNLTCGLVELYAACMGPPLMPFKIAWVASPPVCQLYPLA